jgi:hypothetical protein
MTDTLTNGHGTARERAEAIALAELDAGRRPVARQIAATVQEPERTVSRWLQPIVATADRPATVAAGPPPATQRPMVVSQPAAAPKKNHKQADLLARIAELEQQADAGDWLDRWVRPLVTFGLVAIALLMSYSHIETLAADAGVDWPTLMPLAVDWLMVAGWLCLRRHPWYPPAILALAAGVAGSLAMNAIAARPEFADLDDVRLACALAVVAAAVLGVHLLLKR